MVQGVARITVDLKFLSCATFKAGSVPMKIMFGKVFLKNSIEDVVAVLQAKITITSLKFFKMLEIIDANLFCRKTSDFEP